MIKFFDVQKKRKIFLCIIDGLDRTYITVYTCAQLLSQCSKVTILNSLTYIRLYKKKMVQS